MWPIGYMNESLHDMFMASYHHISSPWFSSLHFDLYDLYPSY